MTTMEYTRPTHRAQFVSARSLRVGDVIVAHGERTIVTATLPGTRTSIYTDTGDHFEVPEYTRVHRV